MLVVGSIVIRVEDLQRQVDFWTAALHYNVRPSDSGDFALLHPPDSVGPNLSLDAVPSARTLPPRIHIDLYAEHRAEEVRRLTALGASEVYWEKRPADADYVIMEDPEGNRFCVISAPDWSGWTIRSTAPNSA